MSSTSSVEAPAAMSTRAASICFCLVSCCLVLASLLSRLRERQDTRGNRARIEDLELNRLSTDGTSSSWSLEALWSARLSFMGSCMISPKRRSASALCWRAGLSIDMSRSTRRITLASVNSMSIAVTFHSVSWKSGMVSLKASATSASSPPGAQWASSEVSSALGVAFGSSAAEPPAEPLLSFPRLAESSKIKRFSARSLRGSKPSDRKWTT
mmetsp:Transcript_18286/g.25707  ORF Transcript_18286/g.25707 Transcript_18286/m.25707 type:complete len:212 (+) Transcript_18286:102-737(+)